MSGRLIQRIVCFFYFGEENGADRYLIGSILRQRGLEFHANGGRRLRESLFSSTR